MATETARLTVFHNDDGTYRILGTGQVDGREVSIDYCAPAFMWGMLIDAATKAGAVQ